MIVISGRSNIQGVKKTWNLEDNLKTYGKNKKQELKIINEKIVWFFPWIFLDPSVCPTIFLREDNAKI